MKRSYINSILRDAEATFARFGQILPPFCRWMSEQFRAAGPQAREIAERGLGWDVTDFNSGDFRKVGLVLITLRNGEPGDAPDRKNYAEKLMISQPGQLTPAHFHHYKMEDIIVRGGGRLVVRLWNATADDRLGTDNVTVSTDGVVRQVRAGEDLILEPGESITLPPRLYHAFAGHPGDGPCILGEVSKANDDRTDNRFLEPLGRFPAIEEDEPAYRLLVGDYLKGA